MCRSPSPDGFPCPWLEADSSSFSSSERCGHSQSPSSRASDSTVVLPGGGTVEDPDPASAAPARRPALASEISNAGALAVVGISRGGWRLAESFRARLNTTRTIWAMVLSAVLRSSEECPRPRPVSLLTARHLLNICQIRSCNSKAPTSQRRQSAESSSSFISTTSSPYWSVSSKTHWLIPHAMRFTPAAARGELWGEMNP